MSRSSVRPLGFAFLLISVSFAAFAGAAAPAARGEGGIAVSPALPAGVEAVSFHGDEAISSLFRFQLDLVATAPTPALFDLLGTEVTIALGGEAPRFFSGICSRVSESSVDREFSYRAEIVPRMWLLTLQKGNRIYQDLSVLDVISGIFAENGIDADVRVTGSYPSRDYLVQYRESDFAWASRLMEEEGIYYYFEHGAAGSTVVLGDTPSTLDSLPTVVPWEGSKGKPTAGVVSWEKSQELRPGKYTVDDYSFHAPTLDLSATRTLLPAVQAGESLHRLLLPTIAEREDYEYPGGYAQRFDGVSPALPAAAQKTALIRMEAAAAGALAIRGESFAHLMSGRKFTLNGHPNANGEYLLTSVQHSAKASKAGVEYSNSFTCIPSGLPFRPERVTPRPDAPGPQSAVVTGPPGAGVHTDGLGRVKVQFHWDRQGQRNDNSSCWIRVVQQHTGGSLSLPQVGDEVLVAFEHGDIDRPIIIGRLYNGADVPPAD